jgi:hypothetical protein
MAETKYKRGKEIFSQLEKQLEYREGVPEYQLKYAQYIIGECEFRGYDSCIEKETMYKYLEMAEKGNKRIVVRPDDDFLPGGGREHQCDGWTYHPVLIDNNVYTDEEEYWCTGGNTGKLPTRITPSRINSLLDDEIFVFGSNMQGMHAGGAARIAMAKFGAEWGNGEGLQGQCYALPTMEGVDSVKSAIERFTKYAEEHDEYIFYVTPVGCGIAGYQPEEVAHFFDKAAELDNVYLPISFWKVLLNVQN